MTSSGTVTNSSSFRGIWETTLQSMLSYPQDYEKQGTPIIGIEDLRALGQIIRPIKARIESASCCSPGTGVFSLGTGSHEAFCPASGQSIEGKVWRR